jgi:ElaB/YqjD/DUF883 family membrane-anchored ribosome-binding protein
MSEITEAQRDKLVAHSKGVVADAEELLKFTAGDIGEGTAGLRQRRQDGLAQSRQSRDRAGLRPHAPLGLDALRASRP